MSKRLLEMLIPGGRLFSSCSLTTVIQTKSGLSHPDMLCRAQLKAAKQSNYGKLRALVEDAEGEATTKSFLEHAKALVRVGDRVLKEYDELENSPANTDRLQLEKGPLMDRWDLDYQGLCHVFVAGRHYGEKVVQNLVVPSRLGESNDLRLKDREGATEMDELAEEMFDRVADHDKSPDDSWGAVALGHLRTWAGVVKGAKSSGASFNEEASNMLGWDQGDE